MANILVNVTNGKKIKTKATIAFIFWSRLRLIGITALQFFS